MDRQSISETIAQTCKIRPVLKPILEAFEPLLSQRQKTAQKLAPLLAKMAENIKAGTTELPLLRHKKLSGAGQFVKLAAAELLPLLYNNEVIAAQKNELDELFLSAENEAALDELLSVVVFDASDHLLRIATTHKLEPQILAFASEFIISAVLRGLALNWQRDEFPDWHKGKCPVCGSAPIIAWLSKKPFVEKNEFLADGGGKKYLHCGLCGTDWHFLRGVCPACGKSGEDALRIFGEEDRRHERIDWCQNCRTYLPQVDLRELADEPDMDAMALSLIHLDLISAEKELLPLKPFFWNMF